MILRKTVYQIAKNYAHGEPVVFDSNGYAVSDFFAPHQSKWVKAAIKTSIRQHPNGSSYRHTDGITIDNNYSVCPF
jgi:hypothetical protein